jgi:hypothetical protein
MVGFKSYYETIVHPGPLEVYMSKAPGNVQNYDGSGNWFKIYEENTCGSLSNGLQDSDWCTYNRNQFTFTIPAATPPGDCKISRDYFLVSMQACSAADNSQT